MKLVQMETKTILFFFYLFLSVNSFGQTSKETIYILFDKESPEIFKTENGDGNLIEYKKFRIKKHDESKMDFYINDEIFRVNDLKINVDSCNLKDFNKLKFKDLFYIKEKYKNSKSISFLKNSTFNKIYLVERKKNYFVKYRVRWITDLIEN